jgi:hypothetical protein
VEGWAAEHLKPSKADFNAFVDNVILQDIKVLNAFATKFDQILKQYRGTRHEEFRLWTHKLMEVWLKQKHNSVKRRLLGKRRVTQAKTESTSTPQPKASSSLPPLPTETPPMISQGLSLSPFLISPISSLQVPPNPFQSNVISNEVTGGQFPPVSHPNLSTTVSQFTGGNRFENTQTPRNPWYFGPNSVHNNQLSPPLPQSSPPHPPSCTIPPPTSSPSNTKLSAEDEYLEKIRRQLRDGTLQPGQGVLPSLEDNLAEDDPQNDPDLFQSASSSNDSQVFQPLFPPRHDSSSNVNPPIIITADR